MLQNKNYQQQQNIKKPIVENQTSGKTKTNATKQELPTTTKSYQQQQRAATTFNCR